MGTGLIWVGLAVVHCTVLEDTLPSVVFRRASRSFPSLPVSRPVTCFISSFVGVLLGRLQREYGDDVHCRENVGLYQIPRNDTNESGEYEVTVTSELTRTVT